MLCNSHTERILCEGLAYIHFGFAPHNVTWTKNLLESLGSGDQDILNVLKDIKENGTLPTFTDDMEDIFNDAVSIFSGKYRV